MAEKTVSRYSRLLRASSAVLARWAVLQFDYGNGRKHDVGFSVLPFQRSQQFAHRPDVTLGGDQHAGVED
jgi:hypothetical protein